MLGDVRAWFKNKETENSINKEASRDNEPWKKDYNPVLQQNLAVKDPTYGMSEDEKTKFI